MNQRTMKRAMQKAQGTFRSPTSPKGSTGQPKGPARMPSVAQMWASLRARNAATK